MDNYAWKFITETYRVRKCRFVVDIPLNVRLLVVKVIGLKEKDVLALVLDSNYVLYSGPGNFNNGYIFCDTDLTEFQIARLQADLASLRAKIRVDVFGKWC